MGAVQEALRQMGLNVDSLSMTGSGGTNSSSNTGSTDTADTSTANVPTARKALYTFIHDLFTTMLDQSNGTSSSATYSYPMTTSLKDISRYWEAGRIHPATAPPRHRPLT